MEGENGDNNDSGCTFDEQRKGIAMFVGRKVDLEPVCREKGLIDG